MVCPYCLHDSTNVFNSRSTTKLNRVWRRRHCSSCKKSFTTEETVDPSSVIEVGSAKHHQPFSRIRLYTSILRACDHLEARYEAADYLTSNTVQRLYRRASKGHGVVSSDDIAKTALETIKPFNLAAYVKYLTYRQPDASRRQLDL